MAYYKVIFSKQADKGIEKIRDKTILKRIIKKIETLQNQPRPSGIRKIMGSDIDYRIRIGDYRIIFQVNDSDRTVFICGLGHRKDIYRSL